MNFKYSADYNNSLSWFEQAASFFGRLLIIFAMVYTTLVFHTATRHHSSTQNQFIQIHCFTGAGVLSGAGLRTPDDTRVPCDTSGVFTFAMMFTSGGGESGGSTDFINLLGRLHGVYHHGPQFFTRLKDFEVLVYILGFLCILVDAYALAQNSTGPCF